MNVDYNYILAAQISHTRVGSAQTTDKKAVETYHDYTFSAAVARIGGPAAAAAAAPAAAMCTAATVSGIIDAVNNNHY